MVFTNLATEETIVWLDYKEDIYNYYLIGYKTNKYGEQDNVLRLPKFLWTVKTT